MISQRQSQKQQLKILPQQIQLLNLYFLNSLELQQKIKNELAENPFLEETEEKTIEEDTKPSKDTAQDFQDWEEIIYEDKPDVRLEHKSYFDTEHVPDVPIVNVTTFKEDAKQQLHLLDINDDDRATAEYIIDILNPHGLMDRAIAEVADDMSFHCQHVVPSEAIERGLAIVQSLEPVGIGACSIRECLLLQLYEMDIKKHGVKCAILLLKDHYDDLVHRQFEKLHHALKVNDDELRFVLSLISRLKFFPVIERNAQDPKTTIIPDFIITNYEGNIQVNLFSSRAGSVFVNQSLHDQLAAQVSNKDKIASHYIKNKLNSAEWFVNAIKQREDTMLRIMQGIVALQHKYFTEGDINLLKPMVLRNVSDITGLDISTISRITSNKYAETHFGLVHLKKLFSEGIADKSGSVISNKVIQSVIGETIESEDKKHPYTDQQLVNLLSGRGYNIARRTVAKYREQMHIPIAQIRGIWA